MRIILAMLVSFAASCTPVATCIDACRAAETRCAGNQVQHCGADAMGCLAWSTPSACGDAQFCSGAACASCSSTNACSAVNQTRCVGSQVERCTVEATGCLAWSAPTSCGDQRICRGAACASCDPATACSAGSTRCSGAQVQRCATDSNGCLSWAAPTACAVDQTCTGTSCAAIAHPSVYAAGNTMLHAFSFDPATGALTEQAGSPLPIPGTRAALHPTGQYLYVVDYYASQLGAYAVKPDGSLTRIGPLLTPGNAPETVVVNPQGTFVYVGNIFGGGTSIYRVDPTTGGLTASGALDTGSYNHGLTFDPTGAYFYLARNNTNDVTRFLANSTTGQLSDPKTLSAPGGYHSAIDPQGRYLFVSNWDKAGGSSLTTYRRAGSDGTLTHVSDVATGGGNPAGVAVTPDGKFVYVVNFNSGSVAGSPFAVGAGAWELSIAPSGAAVIIGHGTAISSFLINSTTGALTLAPGSPLTVRTPNATLGATVVVPAPR